MDIHIKFGDSTLNNGRIIRLFAGRISFTHFWAVFKYFCSRLEAASDVVSSRFVEPTVPNKSVKFGNPGADRSREIPLEEDGSVIFGRLSNVDNFRSEVDSVVASGRVVEPSGMDVHTTLRDSRSNGSRDIRWADFVMNKRT